MVLIDINALIGVIFDFSLVAEKRVTAPSEYFQTFRA